MRHPTKCREITLTVFHFLRDTKVRDLDASLVIDKDVRPFDVTMYNVALVQVIQPLKDLPDEILDQRFLERSVVAQKGSD